MFGRTPNVGNQTVDIDLLPQVYTPRRAFTLPINLERVLWALIAVGVLAFGYQITQRNALDNSLITLQDQLAQAEIRARVAAVPPEVRRLQDQVNAAEKRVDSLKQDLTAIQRNQLPWGHIVDLIVNLKPSAVQVTSISRKEDTSIRLEGITESETAAVAYASRLRDAQLFSDVSIQSVGTKQVPVDLAPGTGGASPAIAAPTVLLPYDFVLVSAARTVIENGSPYHEVFGRVTDSRGRFISGVIFEISSCCPVWTADYHGSGELESNGEFRFYVGPGLFTVRIANARVGRSQVAANLSTVDAEPGARFRWDIVFRKVTDTALETPKATPTFIATPAGVPALGTPVAQKTVAAPTPTPPLTSTPAVALTPLLVAPTGEVPEGSTGGLLPAIPQSTVNTKAVISFTISLTFSTKAT